MIDHVLLAVRDVERSMAFYAAALAPLGYTRRGAYPGRPGHAPLEGLGNAHERYLVVTRRTPHPTAVHFAFVAPTQKAVRAFYEAALAAGGTETERPVNGCTTSPGTTPRTCATLTATTSRRCTNRADVPTRGGCASNAP